VQPAPAMPSPTLESTMPRHVLPPDPAHAAGIAVDGRRSLREATAGLRVRLATAGLWLLIALAAAGGLRALLGSAPARTAPAAVPSGVPGFAEMFVATYLEAGSGQEATLRAFYPGPVDLQGVTPSGRYASRTAAVASSEPASGYWAVTVGAEVLVAAQGGYVRAGTHYYRVGVMTGSVGLVATSLPAEVPAPPPGAMPNLGLPTLAAPGGDAVAGAVQHFFEAFLTGQGDVGATTAPGVRIAAVTPPPYTSVSVVRIAIASASGSGHRTVRAQVSATDRGGMRELLDYSVQISERQGTWAVEALLPAPPLAGRPERAVHS